MSNESRSALPPCDLVMKGGITSGIVYPPALQELSKRYRFRQIGGTSAGAIAAACAAAAEFGSESGKPGSGFKGFQEISNWLGRGTNLLDLFQPTRTTRPLFQTFLWLCAPLGRGKQASFPAFAVRIITRLTGALLRYEPIGFLIGASSGVAVAIILRWLTLRGSGVAHVWPATTWAWCWAAIEALFCAWLGGVLAGVLGLWHIMTERVPSNAFGMCPGHADAPGAAAPALTDWLHEKIQELAGLTVSDAPLTFGQLQTRGIRLSMVTTNVTQGQPYVLPFEQRTWIFREGDMRRLFPGAVVEHLLSAAGSSDRVSLEHLPGYHYLPEPDRLPIVVAMRMSLSFPILICAVPLYTVHRPAYRLRDQNGVAVLADPAADLEQNWFSDGGISSNFPIQFFDNWLPSCPTFGINLRSMPKAQARDHVQALEGGGNGKPAPAARHDWRYVKSAMDDQVYLPAPNAPQFPELVPLHSLSDFLGAIWNTAQNYRDNTQAMLPSYRERIVNVRLSDDEGGLNLTMGEAQVKRVQDKGAAAGQLLRDGFDMMVHQRVRFLVLMPQLEKQLKAMQSVLQSPPYQELRGAAANGAAAAAGNGGATPYERSAVWWKAAEQRIESLLAMVEEWKALDTEWLKDHPEYADQCFFPYGCPKPEPVLRVTPRL